MTTREKVGDVLMLKRRAVAVDPLATYQEIGIRSFGNGLFHKEPVTGADLGAKRVFSIEPGDLVLSNVFAWEGAVALAGDAEAGRIGSHRFMTYVAADERVDTAYLRYFFTSEPGLALLGSASPGSAGRNRTLAIDRFEDLTIPLPDIDEQRRIVNRLDQLAEYHLRLGSARAASAEPTNALLQSARAKFASPHGLKASGRRASNVMLGQIADFVNGTSYDRTELSDDGEPIIRISNISDPGFPVIRTRQSFDARFHVQPGDLLVSWSASFKSIVWPGPPGILNQHIFNVRERDGVDRRFLRHLIEAVFSEMRRQEVGIGMMHLRRDAFLSQPVLVPDLEAQREIGDRLDRIEQLTSAIAAQQRRSGQMLTALRASILNHAFAGLT